MFPIMLLVLAWIAEIMLYSSLMYQKGGNLSKF